MNKITTQYQGYTKLELETLYNYRSGLLSKHEALLVLKEIKRHENYPRKEVNQVFAEMAL